MVELPKTLDDAIAQAREATKAALADGYTKLQVELIFPELKPMPVAEQFLPIFEEYGSRLKVFFPDAGGAALARRDWENAPFQILDLGSGRTAIQPKIEPEDEIFLFVAPTVVEVVQLEKLCAQIGSRPTIMLNPFLEDAGKIGIGYAARQTRERFLNTIESSYYVFPIYEDVAIFRCYPGQWEVWVETNGEYKKIVELPEKPSGEDVDGILAKQQQTPGEAAPGKPTFLRGLQRFMRSLTR
ncbi:DUF1995 family protein [Iningainema tapete]|uniref:DUF1995 family protein n=1 Tax=Iningainema tapete BLCC-T55 TaxID=2748662 RepID=A0A8J6XP53_9CYAN|nr:DUF1995 family protein [Iningainema tapete]MBD2775504.1 DUF1995 family protein [Iningainema tapete BLCC-T55]